MNFEKLSLSLVIITIFCASLASAQLNLLLNGPGDGVVVKDPKVEFIYSFDNIPSIINCSLYIDGKYQTVRGSLFNMNNNKITHTITAGEHEWHIECYDTDNLQLVSDKRTITLDVEMESTEGYTIIYNNNRLRSYVIPVIEGKGPIELPAVINGEDIQLKTFEKTHYVDLLKMGMQNDVPFVEVRDRSTSRIQKILVGEGMSFNLNDDDTIEAVITLNNVERNVKAYFTVECFPQGAAQQAPAEEDIIDEPAAPEEGAAAEETPVEAQPGSPEEEASDVIPIATEDDESIPPKEVSPVLKYSIVIIFAALILAAIIITLLNKGGFKARGFKDDSEWVEIKPKAEKSHSHEHHHKPSFDMITSTSKRRKGRK
ncbi:hypothetical protein JW711_02350 [Candidatus Woesearchaeota archaeon]|nr:hypothetical protein [Candidatus Woesearchaeota archaeon]